LFIGEVVGKRALLRALRLCRLLVFSSHTHGLLRNSFLAQSNLQQAQLAQSKANSAQASQTPESSRAWRNAQTLNVVATIV
jgi:hypothetical protein